MIDERALAPIAPPSSSSASIETAPRIARPREEYTGPATGHTYRRMGGPKRELEYAVTVRASRPGEGAQIGDLWVEFSSITKTGKPGRGRPIRFRLDVGAKRFLFSQFEQALTLGDFARGV
jgi:hypothetical protein